MSIASELNNLEGNIEDSYDAVNDMGGIIPAQRNMDNLDQAIRTIPQNQGTTYTAGTGIDITSDVISVDNTTVPFFTDLATVATTGDYGDLLNTPTIPAAQVNSDWNANSGVAQILNKPSLATVATSGSYNDLLNTPTIPAAQVNSDWDAASGVAQILNKPSLATVATSGAYSDLTGTPSTFTGATSSVAGSTGLVPAPAAGDQGKVLTGGGSWTNILNVIYPVGAIYLSTNNTSPATLFGGTWEQIKDKFILAAGTTYGAGTTGGSATINLSHSHTVNSHNHSLPANTGSHTLTTAEMPSHGHDTITMSGQTLYTANNVTAYIEGHSAVRANYSNSSWERKMGTNNVGGGGGHSHSIGGNTGDKSPGTNSQLSSTQSVLPPYLAVYVWKRTA